MWLFLAAKEFAPFENAYLQTVAIERGPELTGVVNQLFFVPPGAIVGEIPRAMKAKGEYSAKALCSGHFLMIRLVPKSPVDVVAQLIAISDAEIEHRGFE